MTPFFNRDKEHIAKLARLRLFLAIISEAQRYSGELDKGNFVGHRGVLGKSNFPTHFKTHGVKRIWERMRRRLRKRTKNIRCQYSCSSAFYTQESQKKVSDQSRCDCKDRGWLEQGFLCAHPFFITETYISQQLSFTFITFQ